MITYSNYIEAYACTRVLQDWFESHEAVVFELKEIIDEPAHGWGVENILIHGILFSSDLQKSPSSAAQQKRIGESKVIWLRLKTSVEILNSSAAIQIQYLEAMASMPKASGTKVISCITPGQDQFETTNESGSSNLGNFNLITVSIYETIADKQ
ncbi:stomatin-like protein [Gigaspora margarita]|uniref:Stomatin-like protein n=1 Tax=Gigaspora margarita TaxID=4874 RepID=A0A8H4AUT9_GIGMA|nr:stomatin-like protein [Gigaspora margarita]